MGQKHYTPAHTTHSPLHAASPHTAFGLVKRTLAEVCTTTLQLVGWG